MRIEETKLTVMKNNTMHEIHTTTITVEKHRSTDENTRTILNFGALPAKLHTIINHKVKESLFLQVLFCIFIPIYAILMSMILTCWPQHNVILEPEYWYEPLLPFIPAFMTNSTLSTILETAILLNSDVISSWKAYLKIFLSVLFGMIIPYVLLHIIWVQVLEYTHPMPFIGQICMVTSYMAKLTTWWYIFPPDLRVFDRGFRKRLLAAFSLFPITIIINLGYANISILFGLLPASMEWCVGVILPFLKKFYLWGYIKISYIAAGAKDLSAKLAMIAFIGITHSFCLALVLGSNVNDTTAYVIMLLDSIPNTISFFKIIKKRNHRISTTQDTIQTEEVQCLVLKEFLETLIPFIYCISFVIAYFGPNATVLGNIGNDYWHYEKVSNIYQKLSKIATFFAVDLVRGIVFSLVMWFRCGINTCRVCGNIVYHCGTLLMSYIAGFLTMVRQKEYFSTILSICNFYICPYAFIKI